jgi:predicted RNase H-like HicB family nuclease
MKYTVLYEKTSSGYSAHVPDLPGCIAAGSTLEETEKLMREAIEMHLDGMREDGDPIPTPTTIAKEITVLAGD